MEFPEQKREHENVLRQMARTYSEVVRAAMTFVGWSIMAFMVGCVAYVVIRVGWRFLLLIIDASGELARR